MRGEYDCFKTSITSSWELPPRARRILPEPVESPLRVGTTSACAENTGGRVGYPGGYGNYLRVRGEYLLVVPRGSMDWELPPRARRIPKMSWVFYSMILKNGPNLALESEIYSRIVG